jgi:hypothetical protein
VSWVAPIDNGGSAITGYVVTPYLAGVAQAPRVFNSAATTQTVTGLVNGESYTFAVAATNARGTGPQSGQTAPVTVGTPSAPRTPSATPGNNAAKISWTPPLATNGAAVTAYVITPYIGSAAQTRRVFNSAATTQTVTGLGNGNTYTFRVAARNANGTGPRSVATGAITVGAPTAPTGVTAVAGTGSATVHWTAPSSNNGSAITQYVVTPYRTGIAQAPWVFTANATTRTITGLTAGQSYTFKVAAQNGNGTGPTSAASNAVTPT